VSGIWKWLVEAVLGTVLDRVFGHLRERADDQQERTDQRELGHKDQRLSNLSEVIDAHKRMADAAAGPKGPAAVKKDLTDGNF